MILLDTHIWHWWVNQIPGKLSPALSDRIEQEDEVLVSAISCFEMAWLVKHGRIDLGMPYAEWFAEVEATSGIRFVPVTPTIASLAVSLTEHHKDPQDRLIIATAIAHQAELVSFDGSFPLYRELDGLLVGKGNG